MKNLELENRILQEKFSIVSEMNVDSYNKYCEALKENVKLKDKITQLEIELEDRAYNELKTGYKELKDRINKAINDIDILQEIIYQQPTDNPVDDFWLLDKLDGIKNELKGGKNE